MLEAIFRIVIYMFRVTRTAESYGFDSRLHDQNREVWNPKASLPKIHLYCPTLFKGCDST